MKTLGQLCLEIAFEEKAKGIRALPYPGPNVSVATTEYMRPCVREVPGGNGTLDYVWGKAHPSIAANWCAGFASYCLTRALETMDPRRAVTLQKPHEYRAGVVEIVADARKIGQYYTKDLLANFTPQPGDLAIWDRSKEGRPETAWWRHVNRIVAFNSDGSFVTIGGNEGREIRVKEEPPKTLAADKLLGFVAYPRNGINVKARCEVDEETEQDVAMFLDAMRIDQ